MTNNEIRNTVKSMLNNWDALSSSEKQRAELDAAIMAARVELCHRENAASHLRGIPKLQNASSIDKLYDTLNHLNIARLEVR